MAKEVKNKIGKTIFNIFLIIPATIFLFIGFSWIVSPESAATSLSIPLLEGAGLNTQIGDIGGLFLGMGLIVMTSVVTRKSDLLLAVSTILACIAVYRLLSFTVHNATLVYDAILLEVILATWFYIASKKMRE